MSSDEELREGFRLGDWEILPAQRSMRRGDEEICPEPMVYDVLLALARRDGDLVTKDELVTEVWHGRPVGDEVIQQKVKQLRGHFGDKQPFEYVGTLHRQGYRLLKPVEIQSSDVRPDNTPGIEEGRSLRRWKTVAVVILLGFAAIAIWKIIEDLVYKPVPCAEEPIESLAILPMENHSASAANTYIPEGTQRTVASRLSSLPGFTVKVIHTPQSGSWSAIAKRLEVDSLLDASVQVENGTAKIVYTIIRGCNGSTIHTDEVAGSVNNLFRLQERLAEILRSQLVEDDAPELITRQAPDSAGYDSYMRGMYKLEHRFEPGNLENAIAIFKESIRLDESYGPAYLGLATAYALMPDYRDADLDTYMDLAIGTIESGVQMDASIVDAAGAIYGFVYYHQKRWTEAEQNYLRAVHARVVDSNAFSWYSILLASVGRTEDALDMALAAVRIDPDNSVLNSRAAMVYTWLNNSAKAHEYFDRAEELGATGDIHVLSHALLLLREGQLELSRNLAHAAVTMDGAANDWIDPVYRGIGDPAFARQGLEAINRTFAAGRVYPGAVLVARTVLGDIDGAMEVARLLEKPGLAFDVEILFIPELQPLREHPNFLPFLERLGYIEYWRRIGCSWQDGRLDCDR